ncbi:hypothetical protein JL108_08930 [Aeromicrobium sp. YIM 150415]|uniref:TRAP transporter substrate-binding protein n=1 Tax=Aeromicrobium sp. YIM 150415 TaxID=2803912 RepID=UPI001964FEBC|nr:hypothetical protein [Aeromicrobium sp. YIM 150415]MBM9463574.1 hypothetical protein [Aeromicrobium sp. YIM 150415]
MATAACQSSGSGEESAGGPSVAAGASQEDYIEALADAEPIEIVLQMPTPPDNPFTTPGDEYAKAVEQWSGGKITFDVSYSGAIAALPEMGKALGDGLVDMGIHRPEYMQDSFPVATYFGKYLSIHEADPIVGNLQLFGALGQIWSDTDALWEEAEEVGIRPLVPATATGSAAMLCRGEPLTSLAAAKGISIRSQTPAGAALIDHLGASAVSLPQNELYEAAQRGVVDCMEASFGLLSTAGLADVTDGWTVDPTAGPAPVTGFDMSLDKWESLPLAAQQLLWDRLDVYLESYLMVGQWGSNALAVEDSNEAGLAWEDWDAEAAADIEGFWEQYRESVADEAVDGRDGEADLVEVEAAHEKWLGIVRDDLGFEAEVGWGDFDSWYAAHEDAIDFKPLIEVYVDEILMPHRP